MLPLIMAGASVAQQLIAANQQKKQAKALKMMASNRPTMDVPDAVKEKQQRLKAMANSSLLPAQGYYENQIGATAARNLNRMQNTAGSSNEVIAGLTALDSNSRGQLNQLTAQGAENRARNEAQYGSALSEVGNYQQEMWDYNKNQPYQSAKLDYESKIDASNRNLNNALATGLSVAQYAQTQKQMNDIYGLNQRSTQTQPLNMDLMGFSPNGIGSTSSSYKTPTMGVTPTNNASSQSQPLNFDLMSFQGQGLGSSKKRKR